MFDKLLPGRLEAAVVDGTLPHIDPAADDVSLCFKNCCPSLESFDTCLVTLKKVRICYFASGEDICSEIAQQQRTEITRQSSVPLFKW